MVLVQDHFFWMKLPVLDSRIALITVVGDPLVMSALTADQTMKMHLLFVQRVYITCIHHVHNAPRLIVILNFLVCPDHKFDCPHGRVDGQQPPCIPSEQRCDGTTDCIGGEDELDHNCPCEPEGAVRLVDGIVAYRGRVEFCKSGRWFSICNSQTFRWRNTNYNAAVVCHQLGYPNGKH